MPNSSRSNHPDVVAAVLRQYGPAYEAQQFVALGNAGGFSGSQVWRCSTRSGDFCLKCWPEETDAKRLSQIHALLRRVRAHGFASLPVPIVNQGGTSITSFQNVLWELTPWLDGEPLLHIAPTHERLQHALEQLALFHLAAGSDQPNSLTRSPGLQRRRDDVRMWRTSRLKTVQQALKNFSCSEFERRIQLAFAQFERTADAVEQELTQAAVLEIPLQTCIRDIRAEHVLFRGEEVVGIIDFGAVRRESPAGDVARLVGTSGVLSNKWQVATEAYTNHRTLSELELRLIPVFYRSGVILGALNWIQWVVVEKRVFENWDRVLDRLDALLRQWSEL